MINANNKTYQAAAGSDIIIAAGPVILERIIIGADVASAIIEVSDHASSGSGNTKIKLTGSSLMTATGGAIEVGAIFKNGVTANLTNQTDVTFVWSQTI